MQKLTFRFELFVENTKRSIDFYTKVLNFTEIYTNNEHDYHILERDGLRFSIQLEKHLSESHYFLPGLLKNRKGLGIEIVLEVDDIEKEYERIQKSKYPIYEKLQKREWGLTDFRIVDPDGYYLRITSRT